MACKTRARVGYYHPTMSTLKNTLAGHFIVIDGPDGCGKTTQAELLAGALRAEGLAVCQVRDPGGTPIGEKVRAILLDRDHDEMAVQCELMLYMASRAQLADQVIRPALVAGQCVIGDRYISSTVAYQGAGGLDAPSILAAGEIAVGATWPDLTIVLDLPAEAGLDRARRKGGKSAKPDRVEAKTVEYHRRVRELFMGQAADDPAHFAVVDAAPDAQQVHRRIMDTLANWKWGKHARRQRS